VRRQPGASDQVDDPLTRRPLDRQHDSTS
jgi:hypothetical protein